MNTEVTLAAPKPSVRLVRPQKPVDAPTHVDDTIPPKALRQYLVERRRALLTELRQLDRLLGFTTE